ncbi:hypothetical protein JW848_10140 [Candidatus Bipolaricaulota bacterium]|nr:hypothetical protein [Candidatus Bipolaricaulota bacterium]
MVRQARFVRVHSERIAAYAQALPSGESSPGLALPSDTAETGDPERIAAYVIMLDSVNFGSGYFPHVRKRPGHSGYRMIEASLIDLFQGRGPLSAPELRSIDLQTVAAIFDQDPDHPAQRSLMSLFTKAWNDLGALLVDSFRGSFSALVESAAHSSENLAERLTGMTLFRDTAIYHGRTIAFYKRAQILPADLSLAFAGESLGRFDDLHRLTSFADNLVPHVLHIDGILEYEQSLETLIRRGDLIPAGSCEEVEIRASAVHAVDLLVTALSQIGRKYTAMEIDHILWNRGQNPFYKDRPRHRTRTAFY